jgi:hypothetical protein
MQLTTAQWGRRTVGVTCGRGNCPYGAWIGLIFVLAPDDKLPPPDCKVSAAAGVGAEPIAAMLSVIARKPDLRNMIISCGWYRVVERPGLAACLDGV